MKVGAALSLLMIAILIEVCILTALLIGRGGADCGQSIEWAARLKIHETISQLAKFR